MKAKTLACAFASSLLCATLATEASAGCQFGEKNLPGSLGPGQVDNSRSFTINNEATFIVTVKRGDPPITANLGCGVSTGRYHACRRNGYGEHNVGLRNNSGRQIRYRWICQH